MAKRVGFNASQGSNAFCAESMLTTIVNSAKHVTKEPNLHLSKHSLMLENSNNQMQYVCIIFTTKEYEVISTQK